MKKTGAQLRAEIEARMRHYAKTSPLFQREISLVWSTIKRVYPLKIEGN
jgi:hypothetical protein